MADVRARRGCDHTCGCPNPCPGGEACKCTTSSGGVGTQHNLCSCGEHCSCNPCSCGRTSAAAGTGRASCACARGCGCSACAS